MLALTRKVGQKIMIGDNIAIVVSDIKGDSIRLAVEAPKDIKIYRGEIYDAIVTENKQAAILCKTELPELEELQKKKS